MPVFAVELGSPCVECADELRRGNGVANGYALRCLDCPRGIKAAYGVRRQPNVPSRIPIQTLDSKTLG
jgi:hypothetical protein